MNAPAAVLAVVLAETAVGGLALLWFAPTWGHVRHGYEILLGASLGLMAWGAWAAVQAPLSAVDTAVATSAATWVSRGLGVTAILVGLSVLALVVRAPLVGRILGFLATLVGIGALVAFADLRSALGGGGGLAQGVVEILAGALFLGGIWDGLVLGHWYLVERRLSNRYMVWMAWANVAAVAAGGVAVALSAMEPAPCVGLTGQQAEVCSMSFSPLLSVGSMTIMIGGGVLALVAVIAAFNVKLAKEGGKSIQASTGMFYLAVILAPAAEFASKIRFF